MSMDLGDLDDVEFPRKSRTGRFVAAVVGLAAIAGGVGFAAQRAHFGMGSSSDLSSVAAAAAVAAPPPVAEPSSPRRLLQHRLLCRRRHHRLLRPRARPLPGRRP